MTKEELEEMMEDGSIDFLTSFHIVENGDGDIYMFIHEEVEKSKDSKGNIQITKGTVAAAMLTDFLLGGLQAGLYNLFNTDEGEKQIEEWYRKLNNLPEKPKLRVVK